MSDKSYVGMDITAFENNGMFKPISRVTLLADDENAYTAGDDTGMELSASCAHATQTMADSVLAAVKGYRYQAFRADAANLDPAAELGDGVTAGGVYSVLSRLSDDGEGFVDLSAPGEMELEDEYPSSGPMTQEFNRKIAETRSQISKTAEEILLQVEAAEGRVSELSVSVGSITTRVQGLENNVSSIEQRVDSITLSVSNGATSSTIKLMAGSAEIASQTISMSGLVTFAGLSSGTTTINGACIKTGTIQAQYLNLTGAISWGDLDSGVQSSVSSAQSAAAAAQNTVSGWVYGGTTKIDGSKIETSTVTASRLQGGSVEILDANEYLVGVITPTWSSSSSINLQIGSNGSLRLMAVNGSVHIQSSSGRFLQCADSYVSCGGNFRPSTGNAYSCGVPGAAWSQVYVTSGTVTTSDRKKKQEICYDMAGYENLFDRLKPATFKLKDGTSGRTHMGMISQDVERALTACGLTSLDFAGFIKSPREKGRGHDYALRYEEFIPLCIDQIQKLKTRVAALEGARA